MLLSGKSSIMSLTVSYQPKCGVSVSGPCVGFGIGGSSVPCLVARIKYRIRDVGAP